jgi:hypothetical protein
MSVFSCVVDIEAQRVTESGSSCTVRSMGLQICRGILNFLSTYVTSRKPPSPYIL